MIVDVDTHWEINGGPHPLAPWKDRLPDPYLRLANALAGDVLNSMPPGDRPEPRRLLTHLFDGKQTDHISIHPLHHSTAGERVTWMDEIGVDTAFVNPGGYWQMIEFLGAERPAAAQHINSWLADQLADGRQRLHPVTVVDFSDLDAAVAEMARMRSLGSHAFFLYTVQGKPVNGINYGHPAYDKVWEAAIDLGMVPVIHVGNTAADFDGWWNIGWDQPGGSGHTALLRFANVQRSHIAEMLLASLLYGGVFARHPKLTVLLEEVRIGWLPYFIHRCDASTRFSPALGEWPYLESGGEQLRRAVRVTPLPGFGDTETWEMMAQFPEMLVFSSDYPHQEGNADPINLYKPEIDRLDAAQRDFFLGGNMQDCFARMGHLL